MSILDDAKSVVKLVQSLDNIELLKKTLELQMKLADMFEETRLLKEQVRTLTTMLETKDELKFKDGAYWRNSGDGPFCLPCWDNKRKELRMAGDDGVFYCPTCRYTFMTKEEKRKIDALYEESNGGRIS